MYPPGSRSSSMFKQFDPSYESTYLDKFPE